MSDTRVSPDPMPEADMRAVMQRFDRVDNTLADTLPPRIIDAFVAQLRDFGTSVSQRFDRVDTNVTAQGDQTRAAIAGINVNPAAQQPPVQPGVQRPTTIWGRPRFDTARPTNPDSNLRGETDMPTSVRITRLVIGGVAIVALVVLLCFYAPSSPATPTATDTRVQTPAAGPSHHCTVKDTVWSDQAGGCVVHVTDRAEIAKAIKPELDDDERCRNQPDGTKYDTSVKGPGGAVGVAHHVCGMRPGRGS